MLSAVMLTMINVIPYFYLYLLLGIPALWLSVRLALEPVDYKDKELIAISYIFWPAVLGAVFAERTINVAKKICLITYAAIRLITVACEYGLEKIAKNAEKRKGLPPAKNRMSLPGFSLIDLDKPADTSCIPLEESASQWADV